MSGLGQHLKINIRATRQIAAKFSESLLFIWTFDPIVMSDQKRISHLRMGGLMFFLLTWWTFVFAQSTHHFVMDDKTEFAAQPGFADPSFLSSLAPVQGLSLTQPRVDQSKKVLNLLRWIRIRKPMEAPIEPYSRRTGFGDWINPPRDCRNTRAQVLIRESAQQVKMRGPRLCVVESGHWYDPYTNNEYTDSRLLMIDHLVPLRNAYESGAWRWTQGERCQYSNFMANPEHLIPVDGHENMVKGDSGPDNYMPPNPLFACEYLRRWLSVKMIWGLAISEEEGVGLAQELKKANCDPQKFVVSHNYLEKLRTSAKDLLPACAKKM